MPIPRSTEQLSGPFEKVLSLMMHFGCINFKDWSINIISQRNIMLLRNNLSSDIISGCDKNGMKHCFVALCITFQSVFSNLVYISGE